MSLLWRRGAIASLVLLGALAAGVFVLPGSLPLKLAWATAGGFLSIATLLLFDGRRASHALLFPAAAMGIAASMWFGAPLPVAIAAICLAAAATVAAAVAWLTRERERQTSLRDVYDAAVRARRVRENPAQLEVVAALDRVRTEFRAYERRRRMPWAFLLRQPSGVYLHGAAGQGKSFLLDGMFDTTPTRAKHRFHFHDLVAELSDANHTASGAEAKRIAAKLANRASLVMIDEVNVLDPATGLLFMRLMHGWWRQRCVVCISSNQSPQDLFKGVVLPADVVSTFFEALDRTTQILKLNAGEDYRMQKLSARDLYQHPITPDTPARLHDIVSLLAETQLETSDLTINARGLEPIAHATGVAWFDFKTLCDAPVSYRDYLALVAQFPNLVISDVPKLENEDTARRFAWLVEIFYDRRKRLILSAHEPVEQLFASQLSSRGNDVDFIKIQSRLVEMQSSEYDYTLA